ncbi:MAG: LamG-like jellyroll fold domain-containing protein [Gracilimonas sp.]|nr:LamG-like jellyroll fold domain-containing protein [Gracilimonas sp.]
MRLTTKRHINIVMTGVILLLVGSFISCEDTLQGIRSNDTAILDNAEMISNSTSDEINGEAILVAGRTKNVGTVDVTNDLDSLYINLKTDDSWYLKESHLHIGTSLDDFPLAGRSKNPVPGKFEHSADHDNGTTDYQYSVALIDLKPDDVVIIAVHAATEQWFDGNLEKKEGAWASGDRFTERGSWATYFYYTIEESGLNLFNTLASEYDIINSQYGPAGIIVGDVNFDHFVKTGMGITPNSGYADSGVDFPTTIVDPEKGTVEMWAQFYYKPQPYSHGVFGFVNVHHWRFEGNWHNVMMFAWHNSGSQLYFGLKFNGNETGLTIHNFDPPLNTPIHLAIAWDREGIDGTSDYMRIYIDGVLVAANNSDNSWGNDNTIGAFRVAAPWDRNYSIDRYTLADLQVWDHARTKFQ